MLTTSIARNLLIGGVFAASTLLAACGNDNGGGGSSAGGASGRDFAEFGRDEDIVLGDMDAPVSILEYASTTCGHCAAFHVQVFPHLEEEYIETGLVRYTLRALPTAPGAPATLAFMIGRCVDEDRYYAYLDAVFRTQHQWLASGTMEGVTRDLAAIARQAGVSQEEFDACRVDQAEVDRVRRQTEEAGELGVSSTPTFFINGDMQAGALPWDQFEELIIEHLPEELRPGSESEDSAS